MNGRVARTALRQRQLPWLSEMVVELPRLFLGVLKVMACNDDGSAASG